ncbi:MAG: hypothetical protein IPO32_18540, partial [Crocinitomicaceae bacterium]|nr:hypothetical protein [Crocinitomicaceae bacterium]
MTMTDDNGCTLVQIVTVDSLNPVADFEMTSPQFTSNYEGTAVVNVNFVNQSLYYANPNDLMRTPLFSGILDTTSLGKSVTMLQKLY